MTPSPRAYGVPHNEWREHQFETVDWIRKTHGVLIVQAPTGSGKSPVGGALGKFGSVRALTHTINLQKQYEFYGFEPIYGMNNYPCPMVGMGNTADNCIFPENMFMCPVKHECEYLIRRKIVQDSRRQSLSYAYYLNALWVKDYDTDFLYCDEAHLLPGIVRDFCTIEYNPQTLMFLDLPMYPRSAPKNPKLRVIFAVKWLNEISLVLKQRYNRLMDIPRNKRHPKTVKKIKLMSEQLSRLSRTLWYAESHPDSFYTNWNDEWFKFTPLTARLYFSDLFTSKYSHKTILTSATIGNHETFARELGIKHHVFRDVPSVFPPESMPVFTFSDAPRLSHKTESGEWRKWAEVIAKAVNTCDPAWSGLVHVSSRNQAHSLANALARMDSSLQDRVFIPEGKTTGDKIENWQQRKQKVSNTLCISYSFHMGLDAYDDEINIVGKIPFATLDEFGMAELDYDPDIYRHNAALLTEQASGRIRRGEPEHYEEKDKPMRKFVAIADNSYTGIQNEFSKHFQSCLMAY